MRVVCSAGSQPAASAVSRHGSGDDEVEDDVDRTHVVQRPAQRVREHGRGDQPASVECAHVVFDRARGANSS
jgi:hypothetical protein